MHKLSRWPLIYDRDEAVDNVCTLFYRLHNLVSPRVVSAIYHTLWNGWCTRRRFQMRDSVCLFGCAGPQSEDSIEHYSQCTKLHPFLHHFKDIGRFFAFDEFFLLNHLDLEDRDVANRAIAVAAIYIAHNRARTEGISQSSLVDCLRRTTMHLKNPRHPT